MDQSIYLPTLTYWQFGNSWTGSKGKASFAVEPTDGQLCARMWPGPLCSDLCQADKSAQFPLDAEGLAALTAWLEEQAAAYNGGTP